MECIFCKIAAGETRAKIVYDDPEVMAFEDLNPQAPTHILIIPKKHIESPLSLKDEDASLIGKINIAARNIASRMNISDFRLVLNCGKKAGQSVFHLHYHFLAGRRFVWPPG